MLPHLCQKSQKYRVFSLSVLLVILASIGCGFVPKAKENEKMIPETSEVHLEKTDNMSGETENDLEIDQSRSKDIPLLLVYFLGCDLEEDSGAASKDIYEIQKATKNSPLHVKAFLGGASQWWLPFAETGHSYEIEIYRGEIREIKDRGDIHAGESETLEQFVAGAAGADSDGESKRAWVDLILWGHGLPGTYGIGVDTLHGEDTLDLKEIREALQNSGVRLRLLGFDACRMATLQAAWFLSPCTRIFAATTAEETLEGWHYSNIIRILEQYTGNREEDIVDLVNLLREEGVQDAGQRGSPDNAQDKLTVLETKKLIDCQEDLIYILNISTACVTGQIDILDGQTLLLTSWPEEIYPTEETLPGIGESYASFLKRK